MGVGNLILYTLSIIGVFKFPGILGTERHPRDRLRGRNLRERYCHLSRVQSKSR